MVHGGRGVDDRRGNAVGVGRVPAPIGIRTPAPPTPIPICSEPRGAGVAVAARVPVEDSRTRGRGVGELFSRFLGASRVGSERSRGRTSIMTRCRCTAPSRPNAVSVYIVRSAGETLRFPSIKPTSPTADQSMRVRHSRVCNKAPHSRHAQSWSEFP